MLEATSAEDLLRILVHQPVALVLIDLEHEREDPRHTLERIRAVRPAASVVMIGIAQETAALAGTADGWLESPEADSVRLEAMAEATRKPHHERIRFPASTRFLRERQLWGRLTRRQQQVIELLADGADNQTIASRLDVSERAVKAHVGELLRRFRVSSRTAIAVRAARAGLGGRRPN